MKEEDRRPQEGRKLYATSFGEKYHFLSFCKGFNRISNFEWPSCSTCSTKTEGILDLSKSKGSSSTDTRVQDDTLEFERRGSDFHSQDCTVRKALPEGDIDEKTMCQLCAREERIPATVRRPYGQKAYMA